MPRTNLDRRWEDSVFGFAVGGHATGAWILTSDFGLLVLVAASYPVALVFSIIVHELGHAVGAISAGGRVAVIRVLRVMWMRRFDGRAALRWVGEGPNVGGLVVPIFTRRDDRDALSRCILMGPIFSAVFAAAWVGIGFALLQTTQVPLLIHFSFACAVTSLILLANSLGTKPRGDLLPDRAQWRELQGPSGSRVALMGQVAALAMIGTPWRDLPEEEVRELLEGDLDPEVRRAAIGTAYNIAYDRGKLEDAERFLEDLLVEVEAHDDRLVGSSHAEAAIFWARHKGDPVRARRHLGVLESKGESTPGETERARAAVLFAEGDLPGARTAAETALRKEKSTGFATFDRTWLARLAEGLPPEPEARQQRV
jgi:hypothetical protein